MNLCVQADKLLTSVFPSLKMFITTSNWSFIYKNFQGSNSLIPNYWTKKKIIITMVRPFGTYACFKYFDGLQPKTKQK